MRIRSLAIPAILITGLSLTACSDPYDPGSRALGGGLIGGGTGAAIGALAGGGRGAAIGALAGGALGAGAGAVTTPNRGYGYQNGYGGGYQAYGQPQGYAAYPAQPYPQQQAYPPGYAPGYGYSNYPARY